MSAALHTRFGRLPRQMTAVDRAVGGVLLAVADRGVGQLHTGVLYGDAGSPPRVLHLAWHCDLQDGSLEEVAELAFYSLAVLADENRLAALAAKCRRIARLNKKTIRYGVKLSATIDPAGKVIVNPEAAGLTCSTFVMKVFEHVGLPLIDDSSWRPRASDRVWHDRIVLNLRMTRQKKPWLVSEEHIERVKAEKGCARYRPEEVAGSTRLRRPAGFRCTSVIGWFLRRLVLFLDAVANRANSA